MATRRKAVTRSSNVSPKFKFLNSMTARRKQPEKHEVLLEQQQLQLETPTQSQEEEPMPCSPSPAKMTSSGVEAAENSLDDAVWSTPKAKRFRIPEVGSCPPAPKKPRVKAGNCFLRRSSLPFFTQPELAEFFFNNVKVPNMSVS